MAVEDHGMPATVAHLIAAPLLVALGVALPPGPAGAPGPARAAGPGLDPDHAVWPLEPRPEVVEDFSPPLEQWGAGHRGVDLAGAPGQTVRAAQGGTVTYAGKLAGRGVVVVGHGSTRTTYEPVAAHVSVGDRVRPGQPLGVLESFGSHCWPRTCLHWGLIEGTTYLDPLHLVGGGPVRLLPLFGDLAAALVGASAPGGAPAIGGSAASVAAETGGWAASHDP